MLNVHGQQSVAVFKKLWKQKSINTSLYRLLFEKTFYVTETSLLCQPGIMFRLNKTPNKTLKKLHLVYRSFDIISHIP